MLKKYKNDIILIGSILFACILVFVVWLIKDVSYDSGYANVYYEKECIYSLDLDEDIILEIDGYESKMIIEIKDKRVRVKESGCPEQICVHTGWIKQNSGLFKSNKKTITCLPNKVWIKIGKEIKVDEQS